MGKARVHPPKTISIPQLELTAALVSVKVNNNMRNELDYEIQKETFWTDSQIVLGYINNDSKRFHMYVANCISQICSKSEEEWLEPTTIKDISLEDPEIKRSCFSVVVNKSEQVVSCQGNQSFL